MGDSSNSLANTLKGLKLKFRSKDLADFKDWRKDTCLILSINRKDLVGIMKGNHRRAEGTTPNGSTTDESTTTPHTLEQAQATYDKTSQDLYTILCSITKKTAQLLVDETGIGGNGQKAWQELESKLLKVTDEVIRAMLAELSATTICLLYTSPSPRD